jgi:hypothetical protein
MEPGAEPGKGPPPGEGKPEEASAEPKNQGDSKAGSYGGQPDEKGASAPEAKDGEAREGIGGSGAAEEQKEERPGQGGGNL